MQTFDEQYESQDIKNLNINFPSGELIVRRSDDDSHSIRVHEEVRGTFSLLDCSLDHETLRIDYKNDVRSWLSFGWLFGGKRTLIVTLPHDMSYTLDKFELHVASGNATVDGIHSKDATIDVASGNATLQDIQAQSSNVQLSSGKLQIAQSNLGITDVKVSSGLALVDAAIRKLNVRLSSGKLEVACEDCQIDSIQAKVTSGQLTLAVPQDCGFSAAVSKTTGSFNCGFDCSVRGEVYTHGDGSTPIDIHITSGSATLRPVS